MSETLNPRKYPSDPLLKQTWFSVLLIV